MANPKGRPKVENKWAWILIVSTSVSSSLSLLQYENDNQSVRTFINIFITRHNKKKVKN